MARLQLALLGPPEVMLDATPIPFAYDKVLALLAFLAVERDRPHRREVLAGLLWPEQAERAARHNLSQALSSLRRALGDHAAQPPFLLVDGDAVQLNPAASCELDLATFADLLAACDRHAHRHIETCRSCAQRLEHAVALYRGGFMHAFLVRDSDGFDEWVALTRERLHQQALQALELLAELHERRAAYEPALRYARRLVELDPWREETHRLLMRVLAHTGRRSDALAQYRRCRRILSDELGLEPALETVTLHDRIRDGSFNGAVQAPPIRLPVQPTPLVGREAELARLGQLLEHPATRLITLTGQGGVGKTRLAIEAAAHYGDAFDAGATFVSLAPVDTAEQIVGAILRALGQAHSGPGEPRTQLAAFLRPRELLLVLDNFEHLSEAAPLLSELLEQAPGLVVLVTSRRWLRLRGEHVVDVQGLGFPDVCAANWAEHSSLRLFVQHAERVRPDLGDAEYHDAARICRLVEGLPLAIELAAAWTRTHTCREILAGIEDDLMQLSTPLQDTPARHANLRAAIERCSWSLLGLEEQRVLARLSVFRGGFDEPAALNVAGASRAVLTALAEHSLLRIHHDGKLLRYDMHELVRQYGASHLDGDRLAVRERHLRYFLGLAEQAAPQLRGADQLCWLDRLEREHANLRAALKSEAAGGAEERLRLAIALRRFWSVRGHHSEGRNALVAALSAYPAPPALRAAALNALGRLAYFGGQYAASIDYYEQALSTAGSIDDCSTTADALSGLGTVACEQGDHVRAFCLYRRSLAIARELGDDEGIALQLNSLGLVEHARGDLVSARVLLDECLALRRKLGDVRGIGITLGNLGLVAMDQGDSGAARLLFEEALAKRQIVGDTRGAAYVLSNLGLLESSNGNLATAQQLHREALDLWNRLGDTNGIARTHYYLASAARQAGDLGTSRALFDHAIAALRQLGNKRFLAEALRGRARVALSEARLDQAEALLCEALELGRNLDRGAPLARTFQALAELRLEMRRPLEAAQMLDASDAALAAAGAARRPSEQATYEQIRDRLRQQP